MFSTDPVDREELILYGDRMDDQVDGDMISNHEETASSLDLQLVSDTLTRFRNNPDLLISEVSKTGSLPSLAPSYASVVAQGISDERYNSKVDALKVDALVELIGELIAARVTCTCRKGSIQTFLHNVPKPLSVKLLTTLKDDMDASGKLLQCALVGHANLGPVATDMLEVAPTRITKSDPYVQHKCSARFTVFRTSLCPPDKGIEFARKCSLWLRTLRDLTWGLKSKYRMMVMCCTPGANPVRLESLYGDDKTQDGRDAVSQLEIDEWLFRAEAILPTRSIVTESCIIDVKTHELRSREDSTAFILVTFDPQMHDIAHRKLQALLTTYGHRIISEDSLTVEPLMQLAEKKVSDLAGMYKEDEVAMESLIQWKFQWLKAFYVSLVVDGVINPDVVGKWIGLSISKSRGPVWNEQFFLDKFDMMDSCMDDPSIDHSVPCVCLEIELGSPMSFELKTFEPDARLRDLLLVPSLPSDQWGIARS